MPDARVVEKIYKLLLDGGEIRVDDRSRFGIPAGEIEPVIEMLVKEHRVLLRGSGSIVGPGTPIGLSPNTSWASATDHAGIAILQAIFSNQVPLHLNKWTFPMYITRMQPLVVKVVNPRPGFQRPRGYVYLVEREGFRNHPVPSWQWISSRTDRVVHGRIEVERRDFHYSVETVTRL